jgi:hypothetical protein
VEKIKNSSRRFAVSKSLVSLRLLAKPAAGRFCCGRPTRSPLEKASVFTGAFLCLENCAVLFPRYFISSLQMNYFSSAF